MRMFLTLLLILAPYQLPASDVSPYSGEESRAIKSLSASEVASLRRGEGMGLAKTAELNHYPGPKHVLALADKLELTAAQRAATESLYAAMQRDAIDVGEQLLAAEARLDQAFASGSVSSESLHATLLEIGALHAQLRFVHLAAHLQQKELLTAQQNQQYDAVRGYHSAAH